MTTTDYDAFAANWRLIGNAADTCTNYLRCVKRLPVAVDGATYTDIAAHLAKRAEVMSASQMQFEVRSFRAFFSWRADHYDTTNPAAKLKTVKVPEMPVRAVTESEHQALVRQCAGLTLLDRRDRGLLCVLWSTGMRRSELARIELDRIELDHLDMEAQTVTIPRTKTGKARTVGLDNDSVRALRRYLAVRQRHKHARSPYLWLGHRGILSSDGVRQMIKERADAGGCPGIGAHTYRRALAERWLRASGSESLLRAYAGWSSPAMVARYVRSNSQALALTEHRRLLG